MLFGNISLEGGAVGRVQPVPFIYGRRQIWPDGDESARQSAEIPRQDSLPESATDATGLSRTPDALSRAIAEFEREQAGLAPEKAYQAAGRAWQRAARGTEPADANSPAALVSGSQAASGIAGAEGARPAFEARPAQPESEAAGRERDAGISGGMETRSAERSFMGSAASGSETGQQDGHGTLRQGRDDGAGKGTESPSTQRLSKEETLEVEDLKSRDKEVRAHEQAHISSGSGLTSGGASFTRTRGPDGKMYATGGEVRIDTSEESDPDATIAKAQRIKAAAMAPSQPSAQDRQVAAQASQMETLARQEMHAESPQIGGKDSTKTEQNENNTVQFAAAQGGQDADAVAGSAENWMDSLARRAGNAYSRASLAWRTTTMPGTVFSHTV